MRPLILPALSALAAALTAAAAPAQIGFQPAAATATPTNPDAGVLADLDGDGDLDLVVATDAPDKLTLLFNAGGSFGAPLQVLLAGGSSPHTPVAADLDGDGDVDLAVSLKNTDQVQLIVNNGGVFTPGATFSVGAEPRTLVVGDADADGDWDLAVSSRSGNSVSVLRNGGGLAFTVTTVGVGAEPRELAFGDLNGDKLPDLAVAVHDDRLVRLVLDGVGGFSAGAALPLGQLRPQGLDVGDLDGDGDLDIAAAASNNGVEWATVLLNAGGGTFAGAVSYALAAQDASSLVLAHLDGDGALDIATANTDSANVSALRNNGNGTFAVAQLFGVGVEPGHVMSGDVDGNGSADLVTVNNVTSDASVLRNVLAATPCALSSYCTAKTSSTGSQPTVVAVGAPSVGAQGFSVAVTDAVAGKLSLGFWSRSGAAALPFSGGLICVQAPLRRLPPRVTNAAGTAATAFPIAADLAGTTAWFQVWYRDAAHPDGTGVGLSNGLQVTFCD
jgi:hypothetical protein